MKNEKCCSEEEFRKLKKKTFRNIPRSLLINVIEELPDYASIVYLRLYDLAEVNNKRAGTVIISYSALGQKLKKSESSVKRAVKELKEKGYIDVIQQGEKNKKYLPNIIRVLCPKKVAHEIIKEDDRKFNVVNFPCIQPQTQVQEGQQEQINNLFKSSSKTTADESIKEIENEVASPPAVYLQYQEKYKEMMNQGVNVVQASLKARNFFSPDELKVLDKYFYLEAKEAINHFSLSEKPKMNGEGAKNDPHKINNGDQEFLRLTIDIDKAVDNNYIDRFLGNLWANTIVNFERHNSFVDKKLSEIENRMIESKLRAMHKCREFHLRFDSYNLTQLIAEVKYHVIHRDVDRTCTTKHALNAAAVMLRKGTWSTPKRLASLCTQRMEQAVNYLKQKELSENIGDLPTGIRTGQITNLADLLNKKTAG